METNIDLSRYELRYFLPIRDIALLEEWIGECFYQKTFSDNPIVQTVYLNNDEQMVPWGLSLKTRRYLSDYSRGCLDLEKKFSFSEIKRKKRSDPRIREKKREPNTSLKRAIENFSQEVGVNLRPYFFIEYYRRHFVPKTDVSSTRLTIDNDIRYYYCDKGDSIHFLKRDTEIVRIELKTRKEAMGGNLVKDFLSFLVKIGAKPIISKKEEGFNLVKRHFDKTHSAHHLKEIRNCEIEAKLLFNGLPDVMECFFADLKEHFKRTAFPITIDERYPFTFRTTSINHYWAKENGEEGVKVLFKGVNARPVQKGRTSIIDAALGIIERKELKGEKIIYSPEHLLKLIQDYSLSLGHLIYAGYLVRGRKAIWPEHKESGRIYHVSLDRCLADKRPPLCQLEVEYSGRRKDKCPFVFDEVEARKEIIADIQSLVLFIMSFARSKYPDVVLEPHILSKFEWLTAGCPK